MRIELNIYKGGAVEKTYTADDFDIMFGTVEDIIALIDVDVFAGGATDSDFVVAALKLVSGGMSQVKTLLKEVFPELTDEEVKRTRIKELANVLVNLVKFSIAQISSVGSEKN